MGTSFEYRVVATDSFTLSSLEDVQVKPEIKPDSLDDCTVDSESSPTLELDIEKSKAEGNRH